MAAGGFGVSPLRANQCVADDLGISPGTTPPRYPQRSPFEPEILPFTGTFNGNGHVILNGLIENNIFSKLGPGGKIQDLGVVNTRTVSYDYYVSMLCGSNNQGTISRCFTISPPSGYFYVGLCLENNRGVIMIWK
jgi:hypothetical protein